MVSRLLLLATTPTAALLLLALTALLLVGALHQRLDRVQLVLQPRRTLLVDLDELLSQLGQQVRSHRLVHVVEPGTPLRGVWDLKEAV